MSAAEIEVLDAAEERSIDERASTVAQRTNGVAIGVLIGFIDDGRTPLVTYQGVAAALRAAAILDLQGAHIGKKVVLQFENADPGRPVIMGLLRHGDGWPLPDAPGQVQVDADGERLIVSAKEQLVLKCGKASITLTK